jgi:hypothetical protein
MASEPVIITRSALINKGVPEDDSGDNSGIYNCY